MIAFDRDGVRFNYRVAGVCTQEGHVLLQQWETDVIWALPGGRAELLESSRDALAREMQEEMGLAVDLGRLLWFVENFFTYEGRSFHELAVYYQMYLPDGCHQRDMSRDFIGIDGTVPIVFRWFPVDQLTDLLLYPTFLRTALADLPRHPVHVIHTDA